MISDQEIPRAFHRSIEYRIMTRIYSLSTGHVRKSNPNQRLAAWMSTGVAVEDRLLD